MKEENKSLFARIVEMYRALRKTASVPCERTGIHMRNLVDGKCHWCGKKEDDGKVE